MATESDFTEQLRKHTRAAHKLSDVLIVSKLAVVLTDQRMYGQALAYFYPIYCNIERIVFKHRQLPALAPLADVVDELHRKEAIEADLAYYLGPAWQSQVSCQSAAVDKYLSHLEDLEMQDPVLVAPYAYSMYIPLLIGVMGHKVKKTLALPGSEGLALFTFEGQAKGKLMKALKAAMNSASAQLSAEQRERVFAEALRLYQLNIDVVMSFPAGAAATLKALASLATHVPAWLVLGLVGLGASTAYLLLRR